MIVKVEHNEIGKHPEVIKKAQQDLLKMDVLVCGDCRSIYHFVEEFSDHKRKCTGIKQSSPIEKPDLKTNWAFLLWKSSQPSHSSQNAWKQYQGWAELEEKQRAAWTTAGQSLQSISRLGTGAVHETMVKVMRTITDGAPKLVASTPTPVTSSQSSSVASRFAVAARRAAENVKNDDDTNTDEDYSSPKAAIAQAKPIRRYVVKRTMNTSGNSMEVRECLAERILMRRMNTTRNCYEYQVKWNAFPNTWEPHSHFVKAPELLAELAKSKPVQAAIPMAARPVRNSKARAVDQVKQWCTTEDGGSALSAELKRKNADSDYAEAEDSSQDEAAGNSPSPRKQIKSSPQVMQKVVGAGGQVRYYQKAINGAATQVSGNSAEVVVTTSADKATGVVRKPGVSATSPTKKEAKVKVVGKNEVTNSGIVRVGGTAVALPGTPNVQRIQRVVQTVRTPGQAPVTRTVLRQVPQPVTTTPSPTAKPGLVRQTVATPARQYALKRGIPGTPAVAAAKISPVTTARAIVRSPAGQTPPGSITTRVVRKTVSKSSEPTPSDSETSMTLCPVTGKLISAKEDNSELQRLLTNEEDDQAGGDSSQEGASDSQGAGLEDGQIQQLIANEDGSPVLVTGEDGTIYQVAGKNADGQTLLIAQGTGEQACVYLASEEGGDVTAASSATTVSATETGDTAGAGDVDAGQEEGNSDDGQSQSMLTDQDSQDGQITAELVQADEPSADGTRRVVLLLPDGNLMVTEVNEEQYQQFNLGS